MGFLNNIFGKKENKKDGVRDFWDWFIKNEKTFFQVVKSGEQIDQNFFSKLAPKIDALRKELYFLTGMYDDETAELVVTPDGTADCFCSITTPLEIYGTKTRNRGYGKIQNLHVWIYL